MINQSTLDGLKAVIVITSLAALTGGCAHQSQLDAATALEQARSAAPADASVEVEARPAGDAQARLEAVARARGTVVTCPEGQSFCEVAYVLYAPAEDETTVVGADSAFTVTPAVAEAIVTVRSVGSDHLVWSWSDPAPTL